MISRSVVIKCALIELPIHQLVRFGERKRFLNSFFATFIRFYNVVTNSNLFKKVTAMVF